MRLLGKMGLMAPTLWWFGPDGSRLGVLRPAGDVVHLDEVGGEDSLSFPCRDVPGKYDRILWRDPEGSTWREHVVVRVDEPAEGPCEVYAESSLCDLLAFYIEERRLTGATGAAAVAAALQGTGWGCSVTGGADGLGCLLYHANALAALRRVCEVWRLECEAAISVGTLGVSARSVLCAERIGADRGARLEYGGAMTGCSRTVLEDEVCTALYGWGEGLPALEEDGSWHGGYRRKLSIADVNNGVRWVGDDQARQQWGLVRPDGTRAHRFGDVTFPDVGDAERLLALTQAELARRSQPQVVYEVDAALVSGAATVGLGDTVAIVDATRSPAWRLRARVLRRVRTFGDARLARYAIGTAPRTAYAAASDATARMRDAEDASGAAVDAASAVAGVAAEVRAATGTAAGAGVPALATKEYVDGLFEGLVDLSEVEF